jgi:DNA-directed RNA polymerase specialized sigma24 family protein
VRNDLFHKLDLDWASFERSRAGARALARWRAGEPEISDVSSLGALVKELGDRLRPERQDELMSALLRQSREDTDARRVILRMLTPALVNVSRSSCRFMGNDDAASVTVLAAMERMACYSASRPGRPAANLMQDVRYTVYRASLRESTVPAGQPQLVPIEDVELVRPEPAEPTASEHLLRLLEEAISGGRLTGDGGRVIILTRIADVPTATLAKADGVRPSSIRKRRERAEAALGDFAMEVA